MFFGPRPSTILLLLFCVWVTRLCAQDTRSTELSPARIGATYTHALDTTRPAQFTKLEGNSEWLQLTGEGILTGTPDEHAPARTEIKIRASWQGQDLVRIFVIPVSTCARGENVPFEWCDDQDAGVPGQRTEQKKRSGFETNNAAVLTPEPVLLEAERKKGGPRPPPADVVCPHDCIVQFHRLRGPFGALGTFVNRNSTIDWSELGDPKTSHLDMMVKELIKAIDESKVTISGSVVIRKDAESCRSQSWSVVTQTVDSSNNLVYAPSDSTAFCAPDGALLIVLPVHAIWTSVYGVSPDSITLKDPTWKLNPELPKGRNCDSDVELKDSLTVPDKGIRNCSLGTGPVIRFLGGEYNRLTVPGVSQGSISITPWAAATKATWDVQAYESTRFGPGWLGSQLMYEHDRKLADDFNSLTGGVTYDLRVPRKDYFWFDSGAPEDKAAPPLVGVRPLELVLRAGPEWSPSAENTARSTLLTPTTGTQGLYMPKDLNLVLGATARLPVVISPRGQPSQFTVAPVFGLEGGYRWDSHPICEAVGTVSVTTTPECVPAEAKIAAPGPAGCPSGSHLISNTNSCTQPQEIFRRVAGVDASMRWPYKFTRNFFGDRPATLDFSYRVRWLSYAEPFYDATDQEKNPLQKAMALPEGQSLGSRYYLRATLIIPVSAYFQLRATWQRGSLPPLFQYVGSQVTLGLAFSNPGSSEH